MQLRISGFLPQLKGLGDDPRVKDLHGRLEGKLAVVGSRIDEYQSQQSEKERLDGREPEAPGLPPTVARGDLPRYPVHRPGRSRQPGRDTTLGGGGPGRLRGPGRGRLVDAGTACPTSLSATERTEIAEGCYELLLVLSQAESNAEQGLRRLDQAARLHTAPSRAYRFRRAACLERCGDRRGAERERRAAEGQPVTTAFDHYLAGQEHYRRNEPIAAIRHFDDALRQRPDHFWAQMPVVDLLAPGPSSRGGLGRLHRLPAARSPISPGSTSSGASPPASAPRARRPRRSGSGPTAAEADYRRAMELLERKPNDELRYVVLVNRGVLRSQRGTLMGRPDSSGKRSRSMRGHTLLMRPWRRSAASRAGPTRRWTSSALAIERQPDLAALYRDRADVVLARKDSDPGAAGAGPLRPGPGDPAGEAGRPRPGARPHRSRPAAGPRRPYRRGPGGLRRRDRAGPAITRTRTGCASTCCSG